MTLFTVSTCRNVRSGDGVGDKTGEGEGIDCWNDTFSYTHTLVHVDHTRHKKIHTQISNHISLNY